MAQQTAVEWFIEKTTESGHLWLTDKPNDVIQLTQIIKQAKQMERKQFANCWDNACDSYILLEGNLVKVWKDFDKYYNETYGSNNQI